MQRKNRMVNDTDYRIDHRPMHYCTGYRSTGQTNGRTDTSPTHGHSPLEAPWLEAASVNEDAKLCKSSLPQPFRFLLQDSLYGFSRLFTFLSISVFFTF